MVAAGLQPGKEGGRSVSNQNITIIWNSKWFLGLVNKSDLYFEELITIQIILLTNSILRINTRWSYIIVRLMKNLSFFAIEQHIKDIASIHYTCNILSTFFLDKEWWWSCP